MAGLWTPETAVTDFGEVCRALERVVTAGGGQVRTGVEVLDVAERSTGCRVRTTEGDLEAAVVITCTGLQADRVAAWTEGSETERILPFRGSWLALRPERSHLVRGNIYPVPVGGDCPSSGSI